MKKILLVLVAIATVFSLYFALSACNTNAVRFNKMLSDADEYSFKIQYTDTSLMSIPVYVQCFKSKDGYAYRFSKSGYDNPLLSYRQIFIDGKRYEIEEAIALGLWGGRYKVTENVSAESEENFIYKYTRMILDGSYLTMLKKGADVDFEGEECVKFEFPYDGSDLEYIFSKKTHLLKKFSAKNNDGVKTLIYSEYKFEDIDEDAFKLPENSLLYIRTDKLIYEFFIK